MATCPGCGAPHDVDPLRVICIYCNTSLRVERAAGVTLSAQPVRKEDIERVKQLLVDGKRQDAILLYMQIASVPREEAERAIADMVVSSFFELTARLPINAFGFLLYAARIFGGLGIAGWATTRAIDAPAWFVLVVLALGFAALSVVGFLRHLKSTLVNSFGAFGRARVLRRAVLRSEEKKDEYLIAVMFEVAPEDGSAPFRDQENLFVGGVSLQKLVPGNVVRVRFDRARTLVFPVSPVTVLAQGA
jgi:hypothetical protein